MQPFNPLGPLLPLNGIMRYLASQHSDCPSRNKAKRTPEEKAQRKAAHQRLEKNLARQLLQQDLLVHSEDEAARLARAMRKDPMTFALCGLIQVFKALNPQAPVGELVDEEVGLTDLLQALRQIRTQIS